MFNFEEIYEDTHIYIKKYKFLDKFMKWIISILDFHSKIHHDSHINKHLKNQILEGLNNFIVQGTFPILLGKLYHSIDYRIFLFWGLLYSTIHIINYSFIEPTVHKDHHKKPNSNYGFDIFDIFVGSKYNWNDIEMHNHYSFNVIFLCMILYSCV
mgnify:FL=1